MNRATLFAVCWISCRFYAARFKDQRAASWLANLMGVVHMPTKPRIVVNAGDRFGRLAIVAEAERGSVSGKPTRRFLCKCDCGNDVNTTLQNLRNGKAKSCGKCTGVTVTVGERFGLLTVVAELPPGRKPSGRLYRRVQCKCDCGNESTPHLQSLRNGTAKSCGCLREQGLGGPPRHGHTTMGKPSRTYSSWMSMKSRCLRPEYAGYEQYGGRGITIADRWMSFDSFLDDMGERPRGTTLDRIDTNGNYEPGNCRWATVKQQQRNRRVNVMLTYDGETLCISEWAERFGVHRYTLVGRLARNWEIGRALTTPPKRKRKGARS